MRIQKYTAKAGETIFLNGKFLFSAEARISALEPGVLYGWGVFETMRAYNKKIVYLNEHLGRIEDSCRLIDLKLPYSINALKGNVKKTIEINGFQDAYVRLNLSRSKRGADILIIARKYTPLPVEKYRRGFTAGVSRFRQNENSLLSQIKSTSRLLYELSFKEAKKKGFDEAVILNNCGYIAEASRSNIFLVKNNKLFTPSLECGCLDGITRRVIFDLAKKYGIKACHGNFTLQDLYNADEAFLTNSLRGIMPLVSVEKNKIGKGHSGEITKYFIKKYSLLLKNGA